MGGKATKRTATGEQEGGSPTANELPERWSAQRKMELVLRLLLGGVQALFGTALQADLRLGALAFLEAGRQALNEDLEHGVRLFGRGLVRIARAAVGREQVPGAGDADPATVDGIKTGWPGGAVIGLSEVD